MVYTDTYPGTENQKSLFKKFFQKEIKSHKK